MLDVKFYEVFKEEEAAIKKYLNDSLNVDFTFKTIQEEGEKAPPAKVISTRTQSQIPESWAEQLDAILSRSQGYDHLVRYRKETSTSMALGYLATYCSRAVAEHAMMAMFFLLRKAKKQMQNFSSFKRDDITGNMAKQKKALVIGVGNIGSEIIDIASALKMEVKGVDIHPKHSQVEYVSLEEGIRWADIVFSALPLTSLTQGMLDYSFFQKSAQKVFFINISRGEISPMEDLEKLLDEEKLSGLALDVYEKEKELAHFLREYQKTMNEKTPSEEIQRIMRLSNKENVLFTPHNAFNTEESLKEKAMSSAQSIEHFFQTGKFLYSVPME